MQKEKNISTILDDTAPTLSKAERSALWSAIEQKRVVVPAVQSTPVSVISPYQFIFNASKKMTALVIALLLVIGGGGTALASDASRPGDFLFPLERTLEDVQLRLALSDASRSDLSGRFAKERLEELREIIDEELIVSPSDISVDSFASLSVSTSTQSQLEIEADVFTDTTVIKMELRDKKFYFETNAQTREGVVAAIHAKFPMLGVDTIESKLDFEVEDRASVARDRGIATFSGDGQVRVDRAVQAILTFLDKTTIDEGQKNSTLSEILREVGPEVRVKREKDSMRIDSEDDRLEIRMDDDGDSRFELREGGERIRIEHKDGEVRVKTDSSDDTDDDESSSRGDSSNDVLEVEADVFFDTTVVSVEEAGIKTSFVTSAVTKDAVADEVARRYGLSKALVLSVIDFEVEDRTSRTDDEVEQSGSDDEEEDEDDRSGKDDNEREDHNDEDDEDEDKDDEEDEDRDDDDHGGHGRGGDED